MLIQVVLDQALSVLPAENGNQFFFRHMTDTLCFWIDLELLVIHANECYLTINVTLSSQNT